MSRKPPFINSNLRRKAAGKLAQAHLEAHFDRRLQEEVVRMMAEPGFLSDHTDEFLRDWQLVVHTPRLEL